MIQGYFGLPGSGKTTFLTMLAQKELKKIRKNKSRYDKVLTNFYCDGCYKIDYKDLGHYSIENSLILLDEITLDADSRDFKQFDKYHKSFFVILTVMLYILLSSMMVLIRRYVILQVRSIVLKKLLLSLSLLKYTDA